MKNQAFLNVNITSFLKNHIPFVQIHKTTNKYTFEYFQFQIDDLFAYENWANENLFIFHDMYQRRSQDFLGGGVQKYFHFGEKRAGRSHPPPFKLWLPPMTPIGRFFIRGRNKLFLIFHQGHNQKGHMSFMPHGWTRLWYVDT